MLDWYVVIAKQNQDHLAARGLREQGFADVYLPKTFERRRTEKGMRPVASLLLSPYFFVLLDVVREEHGPIKNTRGVQELICEPSGKPSVLRDGFTVISRLRSAEDEELCGATVVPKVGRTDLRRGLWVRIDTPGIVTRDSDGKSVPMVGQIIFLERHKVEVLTGTSRWKVGEADVTIVRPPA